MLLFLLDFPIFPSHKFSLNQYNITPREIHCLRLLVECRFSYMSHYKANYCHGQRWGKAERERRENETILNLHLFCRTPLGFLFSKVTSEAFLFVVFGMIKKKAGGIYVKLHLFNNSLCLVVIHISLHTFSRFILFH